MKNCAKVNDVSILLSEVQLRVDLGIGQGRSGGDEADQDVHGIELEEIFVLKQDLRHFRNQFMYNSTMPFKRCI
jgi:hypothetical protein